MLHNITWEGRDKSQPLISVFNHQALKRLFFNRFFCSGLLGVKWHWWGEKCLRVGPFEGIGDGLVEAPKLATTCFVWKHWFVVLFQCFLGERVKRVGVSWESWFAVLTWVVSFCLTSLCSWRLLITICLRLLKALLKASSKCGVWI